MERDYNLNDRWVKFSVTALKISRQLLNNPQRNIWLIKFFEADHRQPFIMPRLRLLSPKDFVHKMKGGLKELRETFNSLKISKQMSWLPDEEFEWVPDENDQLIRIFFTSIRTAQNNIDEEIEKMRKDKKKKRDDNKSDEDKANPINTDNRPLEIDHSPSDRSSGRACSFVFLLNRNVEIMKTKEFFSPLVNTPSDEN